MTEKVPENVLTFADARAVVEQHAAAISAVRVQNVATTGALGRVAAEDLRADRDYPPFPRATRDGYALRAADVQNVPAKLRLIGQIKAGDTFTRTVNAGECVEIMTGAAVPAGADAVVMVEYTRENGETVLVERPVRAGDNVVPQGAEGRHSDIVVARGTRLRAQEVAVATTIGCVQLSVYDKPHVAILSTGDEVVEVDQQPGPVQIRNSNAYSLSAQIERAGGEPVRLPIAPDEKSRLRTLIEYGLASDLLLLSGGVSMGKYDLVEQVLTALGAEFYFTGVKIQPGKPLVFGKVRGKYFFGLPGNPVSTMVTFQLFARSILDALAGVAPQPLPFVSSRLKSEFQTKTGLTRFLPARLIPDISQPQVEPVPWNGSGDVFAQSKADCLLVVPPDREKIPAGTMVTILPLD
jgi:molybdopterin molybdotransferase